MSSPRKLVHSRGVSYEITYRIRRRMVRQRFPTRAMALDAMAKVRVQMRAGTHLAPAEARITLAAYAALWTAGLQVADSTRNNYHLALRNHILPALGHVPLGSLRRSDVVSCFAGLSTKGLAPAHGAIDIIGVVDGAAIGDLRPAHPGQPLLQIKLPPIQAHGLTVFTPNQILAILNASHPEHRAVLATAIGTGMRQGELLGLQPPPHQSAAP